MDNCHRQKAPDKKGKIIANCSREGRQGAARQRSTTKGSSQEGSSHLSEPRPDTVPDYPEQFAGIRNQIEQRLSEIAPAVVGAAPRLKSCIRYSLLDGGKRLRPLITVLTTEALGGQAGDAVDVACAIEMVHTASLMIDDLPCMDDARQRRGKPANHIVHGEDIAILGAISLISDAFGLIGKNPFLTPTVKMDLVNSLSNAIGVEGLCAGQERDLRDINQHSDVESLAQLQYQKTGALFVLCLETGARIAGLEREAVHPLRAFGTHAGLAFQILDDLLDAVGAVAATGKDLGADRGKKTYAAIMSVDEAEARADQELSDALAALEPAGIDSEPFAAFLNLVRQAYDGQVDPGQLRPVSVRV
jgi:geranylgeranyl diphosphate synthase type II